MLRKLPPDPVCREVRGQTLQQLRIQCLAEEHFIRVEAVYLASAHAKSQGSPKHNTMKTI